MMLEKQDRELLNYEIAHRLILAGLRNYKVGNKKQGLLYVFRC